MRYWQEHAIKRQAAIDALDEAADSYAIRPPFETVSALGANLHNADITEIQRITDVLAADAEERQRVEEERQAAEVARQEATLSALVALKDVLVEQEQEAAQRESDARRRTRVSALGWRRGHCEHRRHHRDCGCRSPVYRELT